MLCAESSVLPFGFLGGKFAPVGQFRKAIKENTALDIPLIHQDYRNGLRLREINSLNTPYFTSILHPTVAVVCKKSPHEFLTEDERREIIESGNSLLNNAQVSGIVRDFELKFFTDLATEVWGETPIYTIERVNLLADDAPGGRLVSWVLRLSKQG